ncbi:MAG: hypothetical protein Kow0092_36100 [Deferrisomatales bacterium]
MGARRSPPLPRAARAPRAGFTLVDLLVTLGVVGIILALIYQIFITQQRSHRIQEEVAEAQQNARVAVDTLTAALTSLGVGVTGDQVRILVAHPHEIVFNADLSEDEDTLAAASPLPQVPGWQPDDPYPYPQGPADSPAETWRYYIRQDPGGGAFDVLAREINGGPDAVVAMHVANRAYDDPNTGAPGEPLFAYYGDFDGDGDFETLDRVDTATSPRVAAGDPLDAVIRRIEVNVITRTEHPDPRYPEHGGYRETRLRTAVVPRNLWDCPVIAVDPATVPPLPLSKPDLQNTVTNLRFRVTLSGAPDRNRPVDFALVDEATGTAPGYAALTPPTTVSSDTDGLAAARIDWADTCPDYPAGPLALTLTATTHAFDTVFGACPAASASVRLELVPGPPASVGFGTCVPTPGDPASADGCSASVEVATCGDSAAAPYRFYDRCAEAVADPDPLAFRIQEDPGFGQVTAAGGTLTYASPTGGAYGPRFPGVGRVLGAEDPARPFRVTVVPDVPALPGRMTVDVYPLPDTLTDLPSPWAIQATSYTDCPSPLGGVSDPFAIADACGNPVASLEVPPSLGAFSVQAALVADPVVPGAAPGALTSPGNPTLPDGTVALMRPDPAADFAADPRVFRLAYSPPACALGDGVDRIAPALTLTPSWDPGAALSLALGVDRCTGCALQVLDAAGVATDHLSKACTATARVVLTRCSAGAGGPTTAEFVATGSPGGLPAFVRTGSERALADLGAPPDPLGTPEPVEEQLTVAGVPDGSVFQVSAYLPQEAGFGSAPWHVSCSTGDILVDTACAEILISDRPDNPGPVPSNLDDPAQTPICGLQGTEVFFRVKDCDENTDDFLQEIERTAGTGEGLIVRSVGSAPEGGETVLDVEHPSLLEADDTGTASGDSPYFQAGVSGRPDFPPLRITNDPDDRDDSGELFASVDRALEMRAQYIDPDDSSDRNCEARALLVPPVPACLPFPAVSFGDWEGELVVHGGDAAVAGDLRLPRQPTLVAKRETAPLLATGDEDRFFNAYVGGTVFVGTKELPPAGEVDQPFEPGGVGASVDDAHPNYFQNVPDMAGLLARSRLDYDQLRETADLLRVRWVPLDPTGALLENPATGQIGTFEEITRRRPGPNGEPVIHDGGFLFVDAPPALQSAAALEGADVADLPTYTVTAPYFTEGLLYVAGSVAFQTGTGREPVSVEAGATADASYAEGDPGRTFTRGELPLDFAPAADPVPAGGLDVNVRGVLYAEGELDLAGGPWVYGALVAKKGVRRADAARIWYDPRWMANRAESCSRCCDLRIAAADPAVPTPFRVAVGESLDLDAAGARGEVAWRSSDETVATVDAAGVVTPVGPVVGTSAATISATDATGCRDEVAVELSCSLAVEPPTAALTVGDSLLLSATGAQPSGDAVTWESADPQTAAIDQNFGPSIQVGALAPGPATVTATDGVGCAASSELAVNCPPGRTLALDPAAPRFGETVALSVTDAAGGDVSSAYTFTADGAELSGAQYRFGSLDPVRFGAHLAGGVCPVAELSVTPVNTAPMARDDAFTAQAGVATTVGAPGVLTNDTDTERNPLTAVLVTGPSHGTLEAFNDDGSFTYRPAPGFAGDDTFTYQAHDGAASSAPATVTITVTP